MNLVNLRWNFTKEEGTVFLTKEFKTAYPALQIDALGDWIAELERLRKILLDNEHPSVRAALWGE